MKIVFLSFLLMYITLANTIATKVIDIDGTQAHLQLELDNIIAEGTRWEDVEIPDTCHRTETRNIPRTCYRNQEYTVSRTCYRTETNRECTVVRPRRCVRRCRVWRWGCRRVCYAAQRRCRNTTRQIPYDCSETRTRQVGYDCSTTETRDVSYACTRTERREVPARDIATKHICYIQLNLGNHSNLEEKLQISVNEKDIEVKQLSPQRYHLDISPISTREESHEENKIFYHDIIIDISLIKNSSHFTEFL